MNTAIDYGDGGAGSAAAPMPTPAPPFLAVLSPKEIASRLHLLQITVDALVKRLDRIEKARRTGPRAAAGIAPDALTRTQEAAWRHYCWALEREPALAEVSDRQVYQWLSSCPDFTGTLPGAITTWQRYLRAARLFRGVPKRPELNGRPAEGGPA